MTNIAALLVFALAGFAAHVQAQTDFPSKPIQLMVGFPAGGGTDVLARALAQEAKKSLGGDIIVVNKPGATGTLAATAVAAAEPDGHTLGITPSSSLTTAPFVQKDVPANLLDRTTALVAVGRLQQALLVRSDSPLRTVKDLVEQARRNPGKVSIGTPGAGSKAGLVLEAIALQGKVEVAVVPFKGEAPALTDLLGGHITAAGLTASTWIKHVSSGALRTIASIDDDRLRSDPNTPTLAEQGFPYAAVSIFYVYGPKGVPSGVTRRLVDAFGEATRTPAYRDMAAKTAIDVREPMSGEALERFLKEDRDQTGAMLKKLGMKKS